MIKTRLKYFYSPTKDRMWTNTVLIGEDLYFSYINLDDMTYEIIQCTRGFEVVKQGKAKSKRTLQNKTRKELVKIGLFIYDEVKKKGKKK